MDLFTRPDAANTADDFLADVASLGVADRRLLEPCFRWQDLWRQLRSPGRNAIHDSKKFTNFRFKRATLRDARVYRKVIG